MGVNSVNIDVFSRGLNVDCNELKQEQEALYLGDVSDERRAELEAHLEGCVACRKRGEALAHTAAEIRRVVMQDAEGVEARLWPGVCEAIAAARRPSARVRRFPLALKVAAALVVVGRQVFDNGPVAVSFQLFHHEGFELKAPRSCLQQDGSTSQHIDFPRGMMAISSLSGYERSPASPAPAAAAA